MILFQNIRKKNYVTRLWGGSIPSILVLKSVILSGTFSYVCFDALRDLLRKYALKKGLVCHDAFHLRTKK